MGAIHTCRFTVLVMNLVGAHHGIVDACNQFGSAISRIEALVGIGMRRTIGVSGDLPAAR